MHLLGGPSLEPVRGLGAEAAAPVLSLVVLLRENVYGSCYDVIPASGPTTRPTWLDEKERACLAKLTDAVVAVEQPPADGGE
ncbi:MAG TPA: hypothetical protein VLM76_05655 [Patescibacteria group bacterium]|nr:hypothetical protein [Patescibacteria group bacterium]